MRNQFIEMIKRYVLDGREFDEGDYNFITSPEFDDIEDFVRDDMPEDSVRVDLPNDNVGPIMINEKFAKYAERMNQCASELYDLCEENYSGYECFSTVAEALDCTWVPITEE